MKRQFQPVLFLGLLFAMTACASMKPAREDLAGIEVKRISTSAASLSTADAHLQDGFLVVTGTLRRLHEVHLPGHVDITVLGPEGVLEKRTVSVPGLASNRRGAMDLPFMARFDLVPPTGSKILIRYHAPSFTDEKTPQRG